MKKLYARLGAALTYLRALAADAAERRRAQPEAGGLNALEIAVIAVVVVVSLADRRRFFSERDPCSRSEEV